MDIYEKELLIRTGLVLISLYPTLIGFRIIKVISNIALSMCYLPLAMFMFMSAFASLNNLTIVFITISLIIFICDRTHLVNFKSFVLVDIAVSAETFEHTVKNNENLCKYLTVKGSRVIFNISDKIIIKEKLKLLLQVMNENRTKLRFRDRMGALLILNIYFIFSVYRLVHLLW